MLLFYLCIVYRSKGVKSGDSVFGFIYFFALRIFPFFFSKHEISVKFRSRSPSLTSGSEESDHFIKRWPSVQLPKSRPLEYWQSSLDGFVFWVLLRPPEKCKFEFTRDITESTPPPKGQENIYPNKSPFLWKYFQDLRMYQQTFSSLTEFQVRRSTQSHDHVHGTPNCVMMLLVIMWCAFIIMWCAPSIMWYSSPKNILHSVIPVDSQTQFRLIDEFIPVCLIYWNILR